MAPRKNDKVGKTPSRRATMAQTPTISSLPGKPAIPADAEKIPPLENGDRLTREEFERRYDAMPHLKKAELIEGVVHGPSPVRTEQHAEPHLDLAGWIAFYRACTPG